MFHILIRTGLSFHLQFQHVRICVSRLSLRACDAARLAAVNNDIVLIPVHHQVAARIEEQGQPLVLPAR